MHDTNDTPATPAQSAAPAAAAEQNAPAAPAAVELTRLDDYRGQPAWQIRTPAATYVYHLRGCGLAALIDPEGADWIDYRPGDGPRGQYRGIPNIIHPEGGFHPGAESGETRVVLESAEAVELESTAFEGAWRCRWRFDARRAVMTLLRAEHPYWMLYEGTPGGRYDEAACFMIDSSGLRQPCDIRREWRLPSPRWIAFGAPDCPRVLLLHDRMDRNCKVTDSFWSMEQAMTVFGFGRSLDSAGPRWSHLTELPAELELRFVESTDFETIAAAAQEGTA